MRLGPSARPRRRGAAGEGGERPGGDSSPQAGLAGGACCSVRGGGTRARGTGPVAVPEGRARPTRPRTPVWLGPPVPALGLGAAGPLTPPKEEGFHRVGAYPVRACVTAASRGVEGLCRPLNARKCGRKGRGADGR